MNMDETSASYAATGEQEGQVVYDLCYETGRFDNDENERGDKANIQTAHSDALFTLQPAVEETLGLIRNLDLAKISSQSKMISKIEEKSSLRKYCSLKQLDRDVLLLVRECKTSTVRAVEELGKMIRRRWAAKYEEIQRRIDMASASTRTYATMQEMPYSSEIPTRITKKPTSTAFHRRGVWPLQLICRPLCLHSASTRSCLSTLLDAMHGLDTSVSRYELLCHVLSFGWDYLVHASSDGSLFVQPISDPLFVCHTNNMKAEFYHIHTLCEFPGKKGCIDGLLDNVVRIAESCRVIFAENIGFQKCVAEFTAAWQVFCVQAATRFPSLCSGKTLYNVNCVGSSSSSAPLLSFADALHAQMHSLSAQLGVHVMLKKHYPIAHRTMSQTYERMKQLPASESHEYIARRLLDIGWEFLSLADAEGLLVQSIRDRNPPQFDKSALRGLLQRKERIVLHRIHFDSLEDLDKVLYINAGNYYELWEPDVAESTQIDRQHPVRLVHLWSVYCKAVKAAWPEMISFVAPQLLYAPAPTPAPTATSAAVAAVVLAVSPVSQHTVDSPSQIRQINVGINDDALFAFYSSAKYNNFSSTVDEASQGLSVKSSNSARYSSPTDSAARGDGQQLHLSPTVAPTAIDAGVEKSCSGSSSHFVGSPDLNLRCNGNQGHIGKQRDDCDDNTDASDDSYSLNSVDSDEADGNERTEYDNYAQDCGDNSGGRRCKIKDNDHHTRAGLESSSGGKRCTANASSHNVTVSAAATSDPPAGLCAIGRKRKNDFLDEDNAPPAPRAKRSTSTTSHSTIATNMHNTGIAMIQQRINTLRFLALNAPNETDKMKAVQLLSDIAMNG